MYDLPKNIKEGWGLARVTNSPNLFYITNGTNNIYLCDSYENFNIVNVHKITLNGKPLHYINEIIYNKGFIYANIYYSTSLVKINLEKN